MMNHKTLVALVTLFLTVFLVAGCGGEEEVVEKKPVVRAQPKAPPAPPKKTLADIQKEIGADSRIFWTDEENSESNIEREAIFRFFTAFLKNDHATLRPMLSLSDQLELGTLAESVDLGKIVDSVTRVDIQTGSDLASGNSCVIAVFEVGMQYQPQVWSFEESDGAIVFTSLESPPGVMEQLSGDWVTTYFKKRTELLAKSTEDDQGSSFQLAGEDTTSSHGSDPGGPPNIPGNPGSPDSPGSPTRKPGPPKMPGTSTK
ncbi:MAG: hypothetical protein QGI78_02270 [Phycisphaerales bacterium]|jgi:hypothetical protein|nr:hypothetical protein [Phycisphaerales bacterium]